jgi:hypothetical protein
VRRVELRLDLEFVREWNGELSGTNKGEGVCLVPLLGQLHPPSRIHTSLPPSLVPAAGRIRLGHLLYVERLEAPGYPHCTIFSPNQSYVINIEIISELNLI